MTTATRLTSRDIAEMYLGDLQHIADLRTGPELVHAERFDGLEMLQAVGLADEDGRITEKGLAALDTIRRRHPDASPYVYYREPPEDWYAR